MEVDKARQAAKEATKERTQQVDELRERVGSLEKDRNQLRPDLAESRAELKTAAAVREQMEERLRSGTRKVIKSRQKRSDKQPSPSRRN